VVAGQTITGISSITSSDFSSGHSTPAPVQSEVADKGRKEKEPVQREEDEDEKVQAKGPAFSGVAATRAIANGSSGSVMHPGVRAALEAGMGADLSGVRVHEGAEAHEAAASINARAFTHRNDIWLGSGESQSDLRLMAHETTHVVQQGAATAGTAMSAANVGRVQRSWLGDAWGAVSGAVSSAVEWVGDSIGAAVDFIKEKAADFARAIPGYSLLSVVMGEDPISGRVVERNGRNFIEAGLDVIPGGGSLKRKLDEEGKLAEAAAWLDEQINKLDISPSAIGEQLSRFWSGLGLADATHLGDTLERLAGIIRDPIDRIVNFASTVAAKLLQIVKDAVISSLIDFIKEETSAYPLLTVILGRDPISGEAVERTPIALLRGFMLLSESGAEQLRQMEESGSLQKAADWLDGAVARLNLSIEELVNGFMSIWNSIGIESLLDPIGVFRQIYNTFAAPVGRIIDFVIEVGTMVLKFIKDALISRLVAYARTIRGYPLLTVLLGRDPFSDEPVERSTENIIHGFMSLMDGGEEQFQEMKQTGAIARMTARIENAITTLNFTWEYIKGLFVTAWESFSLSDLAAPIAAFQRLMGIFLDPLTRLISFVWEVIQIVIEVILKLMNFPVALVTNIINKAMQAFEDIKRDPIGFLKNLLRAVKTGFQKFFDHILTHLLHGVTDWLFKELKDAGISPPTDFSFKAILGFVMDVLGVSVDKIMDKVFKKLAEKIGQEKVDRIRGMIDKLTGIWSFVSDVMTRGPVAIWEYIKDQLSSLWNTVLDSVRDWVVTKIIQKITAKLLSMLDPTGIMAVVNAFIAFYNAIQSFIAYLREMLEIVNSFVEGVAEIARGSVERAANYLEGALARGVPVVIGFLANQVGLSGIGRRIGEMIEKVRAMVDKAIDWLIDKAMKAVSSLLKMARKGVAAVKGWWSGRKEVTTKDGNKHHLEFAGKGSSVRLVIRSDPIKYSDYIKSLKKSNKLTADQVKPALDKSKEIDDLIEAGKKLYRSDEEESKKIDHQKNVDKKISELATLTEGLPLKNTADALSPTKYGRLRGGYGTSAKVASMRKGRPGGTEADSGLFNGNYTDLDKRWRGDGKFYIRGHLLSWHLGGPGNEWRNLTPLSRSGNAKHSSKFEQKVISTYNGGGVITDFEVKAIYGNSGRSTTIPGEIKVNGIRTHKADLSANSRNKVKKILEAEKKVPTELKCSAKPDFPNPVTIPNDIDPNNIEIKEP